MKIAILTERANIALGGAERSIHQLAEALNRQGLQAVILAAAGERESQTLRILCPDRKGQRTPLAHYEAALKNHLRSNSYDLIHSTLPVSIADVYQPRGGSYRETMLQNIQSYPNPAVRTFKRAFHRLNTRRTEYLKAEERLLQTNPFLVVAALSEYVKSHFLQHYALPAERIVVIPNGVHLPEPPDRPSTNAFRQRILQSFHFPEEQKAVVCLFAANNFRLKGLRELILAFSKAVKTAAVPLVLVVAGSGKLAPWRNLAWLHGVDSRVVFLGPLPEIYTALAACDLAVLPTWYDPSSRFILEALALAKPVITTTYNGAAEFIQSGRHGIVIDRPRHIIALTDALLTLSDVQTRQQVSQAIQDDNLREKISIDRHVEQLISLYKRILQRKNSPT